MAYTPYDPSLPNGAHEGPTVITEMKTNMAALRDACVMGGGFFGWALTVTNGSGSAEQPQYLTYAKGTERVRATITWNGSGYVTQAVYEYSSNSGGAYDTIGTKTITYDGNGNVTGTSWS